MKKIYFLFLCGWLFSCSAAMDEIDPDPAPTPDPPLNEYTIPLTFGGDILDIGISPLAKSGTSDLYAIRVYSKDNGMSNYVDYAYGLFSQPNRIHIHLLGGKEYKFKVTVVVEGQNIIQSTANLSSEKEYTWNTAQNKKWLCCNAFIYNKNGAPTDCLVDIGSEPTTTNRYHDRYYGEIEGYKPENQENISVNLNRTVFGVLFTTENSFKGRLDIKLGDYEFNISGENPTPVEQIIQFSNTDENGLTQDNAWTTNNYSETIPLVINWVKSDNSSIQLASQNITFYRKKLHTIGITVPSSDSDPSGDDNNGTIPDLTRFNITLESEALGLGDNIIISEGNVTIN